VRSRIARAIQRNPVSKNQKKKRQLLFSALKDYVFKDETQNFY
jgi:hypothetical protein